MFRNVSGTLLKVGLGETGRRLLTVPGGWALATFVLQLLVPKH